MSQTNKAAIEARVVIDEEFQTNLEVLITLRELLKDTMELYLQNVPSNAIWGTGIHDLQRQLREGLSQIRRTQPGLMRRANLRLKNSQRTGGN